MPKPPPFLGELSDEDADWFGAAGEQRRVHAGEVIITEGVTPDHIHLVLEGSFIVSSEALGDPEIQRIGPGELMGEMSYIQGIPPGGSVRAVTDGVLLSVRRADIDAKIELDPAFGSRFRKVISEFAFTRVYQYGRRRAGDHPPSPPSGPDDDLRVHELIEKLLRGEF